jgi:uroporphyrinogen-III synthase
VTYQSPLGNAHETIVVDTAGVNLPTLDGFVVGITADRRREEQAELLRRRGAEVIHGPSIKTLPLGPEDTLRRATESIIVSPPDILIANTGIGMRAWFAAAESWGMGEALLGALAEADVLARGPKAAGAVHQAGLRVSSRAASERLSEVCEIAIALGISGRRIAFQRHGDDAPDLIAALEGAGAIVEEVPVYNWTLPTDPTPALRLIRTAVGGGLDAITFTSAPAVRNLLLIADENELLAPLLDALNDSVVVACVGPVCAGAAEDLGLLKPVVPAKARLGPLILEMAEALVSQSSQFNFEGHDLAVRGSNVIVDGVSTTLSARERSVLRLLIARDGALIAKSELLRLVWGETCGDTHVIEVTMSRLRSRLGPAGGALVSVARRGYRFTPTRCP